MKVIHVVSRMITGSSGPSYSVPRLCQSLVELGVEVELHMVGPPPDLDTSFKIVAYKGVPGFGRIGWSPSMLRGLTLAAKTADIVHSHSLWMLPNIYPGAAVNRATGAKLVVSPRGTLSEWAMRRGSWRKKCMWSLGQKRTLQAAACLHATSDEERSEIRGQALHNSVATIPNGIDIPSRERPELNGERRRVLFLSRIHPKKGVDLLLRAWAELGTQFPDWELVIAGPLEGDYPEEMRNLAGALDLARVTFCGELTGNEKGDAYFSSELFVLPTHSENFGMVVAEALAHEVPVIVTKGAPWSGLAENRCGWWIENGLAELSTQMRASMRLSPTELREMGRRGAIWMQRDFSWESIGANMLEVYRWARGEVECPGWVTAGE